MFRVVKKFQRYVQIQRHYSKTVRELHKLTNRDLADLGISRSDIEFVARKAAIKHNCQLS